MSLKESRIVGTGPEISVYLKEVIKGLEENRTIFELRFTLNIDPGVLDLINNWEEDKPNFKPALMLLLGFLLGLLVFTIIV